MFPPYRRNLRVDFRRMSLQTQKRELEPEQAAAAYEIRKHISVTAGPGSGKTTVLVERYLHILREHKLNIDQIVAITFTNRAANEMRERLREQLNLILQTVSADERRHWLNYKRTLDGAVITTIHGFCARLLREFPVEARVDPQFLLLDEHRAAMLLESVVEEALTEFISAGHVEISRLTLGVGRGKLAAALGQLYRDVRGQGLSLTDLALRTAQSHATEADHARAVVELSRAMDEFLTFRRTTLAARASRAEISTSWSNLQPLISSIPEVEALADYCRAVEGFRKARPQARGDLKEYVQALDTLVWEKDLLGRVPQVSLDLFASQYALEIALLLRRIDDRLNEEKQKLSALDFDDLLLETVMHRPVCLGHIDCYNEAVEILSFRTLHWIRTCFFFLSPTEAQTLGSFVTIRDGGGLFSGNPSAPFCPDAPLSSTYRTYITNWLTGGDIGQGVAWHSSFALTSETLASFERKALAFLLATADPGQSDELFHGKRSRPSTSYKRPTPRIIVTASSGVSCAL